MPFLSLPSLPSPSSMIFSTSFFAPSPSPMLFFLRTLLLFITVSLLPSSPLMRWIRSPILFFFFFFYLFFFPSCFITGPECSFWRHFSSFLFFLSFWFCLWREGGIYVMWKRKEGRVVFHHNYFFLSTGLHMVLRPSIHLFIEWFSSPYPNPLFWGVAFLPNKKNSYYISQEFVFISLSLSVCAHVLRDRLCFVSLLFPNNPCSEPFYLYSCEILVQGRVGRSGYGIFLKRLSVRVIGGRGFGVY